MNRYHYLVQMEERAREKVSQKLPTFLTAEWRKLAIANYAVDRGLLRDFLPYGTEIDTWRGNSYASLVGFLFLNTRLKGFSVPCHANFEEVNLRFYVRYNDQGNWKRGVVFIREIVPRPALTLVANRVYGEHYQTLPMKHEWIKDKGLLHVTYSWRKHTWQRIAVTAATEPIPIDTGSEEEFITEHYWGYTRINKTSTSQYEVRHPRWSVYPVQGYHIEVDFEAVYGTRFSFLSHEKPVSVMLAEGSEIAVMAGSKIYGRKR